MEKATLIKKVYLLPFELDSNYKACLLEKINKSSPFLDKNHGYVLKATSLIEILDQTLSNVDSMVVFTVKFEVDVLNPQVGKIFSGTVVLIFDQGMLISVQDIIQVIIPKKTLLVPYNKNTNSYGDISMGTTVCIRIDNMQYNNNKFSCIGKLV